MIGIAVLLLLSLFLPHVGLRDQAAYGRSLLPTSFYFLHVQPSDFPPPVHTAELAFGFNVTYLGLGCHQLGLLLGFATFWSLAPEDINRWIYRLLVISGWLLLIGAPLVVIGPLLIARSGVPTELGVAWLPLLLAGLVLTVSARRARYRIDNTWYLTGPELM